MQGAAETLRETDKYAWVRYWGGAKEYKEKKFLCVNGPLQGQRLSRGQIVEQEHNRKRGPLGIHGRTGYCQFNNAGVAPESMIWVYFS